MLQKGENISLLYLHNSILIMIYKVVFSKFYTKVLFFTFPSFFSAFCQQLEDMITEKIEAFQELREKARNFRTCLRDEEAKSRLLMHRN